MTKREFLKIINMWALSLRNFFLISFKWHPWVFISCSVVVTLWFSRIFSSAIVIFTKKLIFILILLYVCTVRLKFRKEIINSLRFDGKSCRKFRFSRFRFALADSTRASLARFLETFEFSAKLQHQVIDLSHFNDFFFFFFSFRKNETKVLVAKD